MNINQIFETLRQRKEAKAQYPNSLANAVNRWRSDTLLKAFAAIGMSRQEWVSSEDMSRLLGVDPRELLELLQNDDNFIVGMAGEEGHPEIWFGLNPDRPLLKIGDRPPGKLICSYVGGSQAQLTKRK